MEKSLPCQTGFGQVRMAVPSDADAIVDMAHRLSAYHGDAATLSRGDLLRDAFADPPWIYLILAEAEGMAVGYAALCRLIRLQFGTRGFDLHHLFTEPAFRGRGGRHRSGRCVRAEGQSDGVRLFDGQHASRQPDGAAVLRKQGIRSARRRGPEVCHAP